jgi:hypothetical protein
VSPSSAPASKLRQKSLSVSPQKTRLSTEAIKQTKAASTSPTSRQRSRTLADLSVVGAGMAMAMAMGVGGGGGGDPSTAAPTNGGGGRSGGRGDRVQFHTQRGREATPAIFLMSQFYHLPYFEGRAYRLADTKIGSAASNASTTNGGRRGNTTAGTSSAGGRAGSGSGAASAMSDINRAFRVLDQAPAADTHRIGVVYVRNGS